jgi:hypothetical protein
MRIIESKNGDDCVKSEQRLSKSALSLFFFIIELFSNKFVNHLRENKTKLNIKHFIKYLIYFSIKILSELMNIV